MNYIVSNRMDMNILYGLLGWVNSDLFNYIFLLHNGTNVVAISELKLLPVDIPLLTKLAPIAQSINCNLVLDTKISLLEKLNQMIYDNYSLSIERTATYTFCTQMEREGIE